MPKTIRQKHSAGIGLERRAKAAINELGGQACRMPGSGAIAGFKGDLSISLGAARFLAEVKKSMNAQGIKIKVEWLLKITQEAEAENRQPALIFAWQRGPLMAAMPKANFRRSFLMVKEPIKTKCKFLEVEAKADEFSFLFSRFPELGEWYCMTLESWVHSCWMQEQSG